MNVGFNSVRLIGFVAYPFLGHIDVLNFNEAGLNKKDADAALKFVGDSYIQHNSNASDGPKGFRGFVTFLRKTYPDSHSEIKASFVDGDYVILHVHAVREPGEKGGLDNGKVVEHWDVSQSVPEKSANNTMF